MANNNSKISNGELGELLKAITSNYFFIVAEWKKYFNVEEVKFYC